MWVALTLVCALCVSLSDAFTKRGMQGGADVLAAAWVRVALAAPLYIPLFFFIDRPEAGPGFYRALLVGMPFEVLALVLYCRALMLSPLSLTLPFLAFTPVFIILTAYLFAGESVTPYGAAGIALVVVGSYVLNLSHIGHGLLGPFRAIGRERGSLLMLIVSAIFSITATFIKVGINSSSPLFYGAVYFLVLPVVFTPFAAARLSTVSRASLVPLAMASVLHLAAAMTHVVAASMVNVAYMVSVKRTSLLFGVLLGWRMFREAHIGERAAGAAIMLAGFVIVVLKG